MHLTPSVNFQTASGYMVNNFKSLRELIYTRPHMFIDAGSEDKWDNESLHRLITHVISQAVEPIALNQCSVIRVSLESEDVITIEDDGRGLPVATPSRFPNSDVAALTLLLEGYLLTGEPTKEKYEEYGFLSYFTTLLNVLSETLRIDTVWQGQAYAVSGSRGDIVTPLQKVDDGTLSQGTRIRFKPDPAVFLSPAFSEAVLRRGINEIASEFPQVEFEFTAINNK